MLFRSASLWYVRAIDKVDWKMLTEKVASVRARENRRASSPSIDTDKSITEAKAPEKEKKTPKVLQIHQGAGVTKKAKSGRKAVLSARAKKRQEDAMDRAEAQMDKKSTRIEKSKDRARNTQNRSKDWEEQNRKAEEARRMAAEILMKEAEWEDEEELEEEEEVKVQALRPSAFASTVAAMLAEAEAKKGGAAPAAAEEEL